MLSSSSPLPFRPSSHFAHTPTFAFSGSSPAGGPRPPVASVAMGIRMAGDAGGSAFSEDVLKIDIYGPEQSHLTLIDVPGIFRIPTLGLTTDDDIRLVRNMVQRYMRNERTVILAVLPRNVDIANQEILRLAAAADPAGRRTMGVLTKPDLATERATQDAVLALTPALRLITRVTRANERFADTFWNKAHVQHFRGQQPPATTTTTTTTTTPAATTGHFRASRPRSGRKNRGPSPPEEPSVPGPSDDPIYDIDDELRGMLTLDHACPPPKPGPLTDLIRDVYLTSRGPELGTFSGTVLACIFTRLTAKWEPLVLAHVSHIIVLVNGFVRQRLAALCPDDDAAAAGRGDGGGGGGGGGLRDRLWDGLLREPLLACYRGALDHARFLLRVERDGLPLTLDPAFARTVQQRRHSRLVAGLVRRVEAQAPVAATITHVHPVTGKQDTTTGTAYVTIDALKARAAADDDADAADAANDDQHDQHDPACPPSTARVCADLLDTVESYYAVARTRFVDTLCQHVVHHLLLFRPDDGPLALLAPTRILPLTAAQLDALAGEDAATRHQRRVLGGQLASLDDAMAVLRS